MRIKLVIEYDGASYSGWQRQINALTIQEVIEESLWIYLKSIAKKDLADSESQIGSSITKDNAIIRASGRTDAGVSARALIGVFEWPEILLFEERSFLRALNGITPFDISILEAKPVEDDFEPRGHAKKKHYSYLLTARLSPPAINRDRIWHVPWVKNISLMKEAALLFEGTHNFQAFRASDCYAKTSTRTIFSSELNEGEWGIFNFHVQGNGFLKHMVRMIVGELVNIGSGRTSIQELDDMLEHGTRHRQPRTAPPRPLTLESVEY